MSFISLFTPPPWQRVLVLGSPGAGKSTLARRLGGAWNLPVIHLDREYWRPGWTPSGDDEFRARLDQILIRPQWIIDGNFHVTLPRRLAFADAVIYLDVPRLTCLWRIFLRRFKYLWAPRPDLPRGCPEQFDREFTAFVWRFRTKIHPQVMAHLEEATDVDVKILRGRGIRDFWQNPP